MPKHKEVFINSIANPLQVGIYEDKQLIKSYSQTGKTSDILPIIFDELLKSYHINSIVYTKGPGSFMAIKLAYVFFKTLQITKNINFLATDAFYFNENKPIKAVGNSYFVKKKGIISLEKEKIEGEFTLPKNLNKNDFSEEVEPLYILKAV